MQVDTEDKKTGGLEKKIGDVPFPLEVRKEIASMTVRQYMSLSLIYRIYKFGWDQTVIADHLVHRYIDNIVLTCTSLSDVNFMQRRMIFNTYAYPRSSARYFINCRQDELIQERLHEKLEALYNKAKAIVRWCSQKDGHDSLDDEIEDL